MTTLLADLWRNLNSGFAFALFLRRGVADFRVGVDPLFTLLLCALLLDISIDHINNRPDPSFNHYAFATFALKFVLFVLAGYLLSVLLRRREALLPMVVIFFSTALPFALGELAIRQSATALFALSPDLYRGIIYLYLGWFIAVALRATRCVFDVDARMRLLALPVLLVVWLLPLRYGDWDNRFWEASAPERDDSYAAYRKMDAEGLLYAQPGMVKEALQGLAPQRPGVPDLYFVSFGGYAYQDVFMKEVRHTQQTMEQRFDSKGHTLALVNNLQTRDTLPLATASNLRMVLNHLGQSMEGEEDLLMLYLTSHGSESHKLAVDFWPLPLNDISPQGLREMLDEAGIKWRLIVVSACYSGGFIEALKDEHTLVATAAAADRQSFGCGNKEEFTYFGEALFRDQLGRGSALLDAFEQTRETIAAREKRERLTPSRPQLYVAPLMAEKLQQFAATPELQHCSGNDGTPAAVDC